MKTFAIICLALVGVIIGACFLPEIFGAVFGLGVGLLGLVFGVVVTVATTVFGLVLGALGTVIGVGFGFAGLLLPLAILALPFVLLALLIKAIAG